MVLRRQESGGNAPPLVYSIATLNTANNREQSIEPCRAALAKLAGWVSCVSAARFLGISLPPVPISFLLARLDWTRQSPSRLPLKFFRESIIEIGQGPGRSHPSPLSCEANAMPVDAIHATLGIVFTFIWLVVGQILVGSR
jgi:hypothetical protein